MNSVITILAISWRFLRFDDVNQLLGLGPVPAKQHQPTPIIPPFWEE